MSLKQFAESLLFLGPLFSEDESKKQQKRLGEISKQYGIAREPLRQARMNALSQSMGLFEPVNSAMARLYGSDATFDFNKLLQDPMRDYESGIEQETFNQGVEDLNKTYNALKDIGPFSGALKKLQKKVPESTGGKVIWNPKTNRYEVA